MHKEDTEMNSIFMYFFVSFVTVVSKEHESQDKRGTKSVRKSEGRIGDVTRKNKR